MFPVNCLALAFCNLLFVSLWIYFSCLLMMTAIESSRAAALSAAPRDATSTAADRPRDIGRRDAEDFSCSLGFLVSTLECDVTPHWLG